jgi:hypothetical protein
LTIKKARFGSHIKNLQNHFLGKRGDLPAIAKAIAFAGGNSVTVPLPSKSENQDLIKTFGREALFKRI